MTPAPPRLADPREAAVAAVQAVLAADLAATELAEKLLYAFHADNPGGEDRASLEDALFTLYDMGVRAWYEDRT